MMNTHASAQSSIRTVSITLIVFSALVIMSNGMGALASVMLNFDAMVFSEEDSKTPMAFILAHYFQMAVFMIVLGATYLFGGIFLLRHKQWARRLIIVISVVHVMIIWIIMISLHAAMDLHVRVSIFVVWPVIVAIAWTIPFGILIWFLSRKNIITLFR